VKRNVFIRCEIAMLFIHLLFVVSVKSV